MKNLIVFGLLLSSAACIPTKTIEGEASSGNINSNAPYLWESGFPKDLQISTSFSASESQNITDMGIQWETGVNNKVNFFDHTTTSEVSSSGVNLNLDNLGKDGITGIYKVVRWPTSLPGSALAVTQLFGRRFNIGQSNEYVRIEHADILINEHLYNFYTGNSGTSSEFDLKTVVLHEMGHFLGLSHRSSDDVSVMIPSISPSSKNRAPTALDKSDIVSKYSISLTKIGGESEIIYKPDPGDEGLEIKILIELYASGDCVHRENGVQLKRHSHK